MKYRINYFSITEFLCPCCKSGRPAALLVYYLEIFRRAWSMPVIINSGYRCEKHNQEVGGAEHSRHMIGCAADIRPDNPQLIGPFQTLAGYIFGRQEGWELKLYPRFIHVAVPRDEQEKIWNGGIITLKAM